MAERRQEKIGWIGGWAGGFVWVAILAVVLLVQGKALESAVGLVVVAIAGATIFLAAPWRHPRTSYRLLLLPIYLVLFLALVWAAWAWDGWQQIGIRNWWSAFLLLPVLLPLWTIGSRRWEDGGP